MSHLLLSNSFLYIGQSSTFYYVVVALIALVVAAVTFYIMVKLYVHK
ncbi:putative membrane protein [[Clostridium] cellulosi]|uniref:Putative membrane protein n=1 Tax=[Clostridium] cellulosi TaxID=29343 RepID=A0A078KM83_9FIRM|nr:putative membrane protein [[Clostridium] cellulosi]